MMSCYLKMNNEGTNLPKDLIVLIGNLLDDDDLRTFSKVSKRYRGVVTKHFRDYLVVLNSMEPILLIECRHPDFRKIMENSNENQHYIYHRFITSYHEVYLTNFRYTICQRAKRVYGVARSREEYRKDFESRLISEDNIMYICPNKQETIDIMINWLRIKVIDVMDANGVPLYVDSSDYDGNPKTNDELINLAKVNLSTKMNSFWDVDANDTYCNISMVHLKTSNDVVIYMRGHMDELMGITVDKEFDGLTYMIHDNCGRPFMVKHNDSSNTNTVTVLKQPRSLDDDNYGKPESYNILAVEYKDVKRVLPGKDTHKKYLGNSVLLDLGESRYVFIGQDIYEFTTPNNDYIDTYYSLVGNSDVPYPVAISQNNAYFMMDDVYIPKSKFPENCDWMDGYAYFYGHIGPNKKQMKGERFPNHLQIHARIW